MRKHLIVLTILLVVVYACKHQVYQPAATVTPPAGGGSGTGTGSSLVCFEADVLPIFKSSCEKSGCHNAASHQKDYILDSYGNIMKGIAPKDTSESKIFRMITEVKEDKRMPQAPNPRLTRSQIDLIKKWIMEGAQNTVNCSNSCDTTLFAYAQYIKPIVDNNCVGCHNGTGNNAPASLNYTTHAGLQAVALNGKLIPAITHTGPYPMPKSNPQRKLADCEISKIRKWVQAGAPNN